jgi:hypothetical protein
MHGNLPNKWVYNEQYAVSQLRSNQKLKLASFVNYIESSGGIRMERSSASHHCIVCNGAFVRKFSLKRHLGVKHNVDEEGRRLTSERLEYLRHQSDHHYIRNGERSTDNQCPIKSTSSQLQTSEVLFDAPRKRNETQFVLVDPVFLAKICSRTKANDHLESTHIKTDSSIQSRNDDCHNAEEEPVRTNFYRQLPRSIERSMGDSHFDTLPVHRQSQKQHDQASIPVRGRLSKNISTSKQQWICY